MSGEFVRFPGTAHLWVAPDAEVRDDKVLDELSRDGLLGGDVVVEEKVDGDNVGLSVSDGEVRAQHRGDYIRLDEGVRYPYLKSWIATHQRVLLAALGNELVVFGEWCALVHTVRYDALPDWFLTFDVYDRTAERFFSTDRRDAWATGNGLQVVPRLDQGHFTLDALHKLDRPSRLGSERMEGVVIRRNDGAWLIRRAKLVRAQFVQRVARHWRRRQPEFNRLDRTALGLLPR